MDGITYVIAQLGLALQQANARIQQLEQALAAQSQETPQPQDPTYPE